MYFLPNSVSDADVYELKGISWLAANLPWSVLNQ